MPRSSSKLARLDHRFVWHPFTQMRDWLKEEPIVIVSGKGCVLKDEHGRAYLDGNASIWTNLHGHNHPAINGAIRSQLGKIAHSSALGLANEPASLLAQRLIALANPSPWFDPTHSAPTKAKGSKPSAAMRPKPALQKVFYSDDGSTAMEVALKLAYEFARRTGRSRHPRFLSLEGAYHGDTVGAVSLGHIDLFHRAYAGLLFKTDKVMAPYCYRCPFNRARPERSDARSYRQCRWECVGLVERSFQKQKKIGQPYAGFVFEPLLQGPAGMIPQPDGWLRQTTQIARDHGALLIADEIMTGLGRAVPTQSKIKNQKSKILFACHHEGVQPDFLALAKGLTGGYLPMAATLTTQAVFDAFLGDYEECKTFFHGHSFTGNQLGAAAALASLDLLAGTASRRARLALEQALRRALESLWDLPQVGDIRQVGQVAAIELVQDWRTRRPFRLAQRAGIKVCQAMARRGVLTRSIGNVVVLMPPYCATARQASAMVQALYESVDEALPPA